MAEYVRKPQNNTEKVQLIVSDNRYQSIQSLYLLNPQSEGYIPLTSPSRGTRDITISIMSDVETVRNIYSLGYDISSPFIMNGEILNDVEDENVEKIRRAYYAFKHRLDSTFFQSRSMFLADPGFYNFQNFFAKNAFSIKMLEGLLDTRNSMIYRSNSLQRESNQRLIENSIFGRTVNNNLLIRNFYENIYFSSSNLNSLSSEESFEDGLGKIVNYYNNSALSNTRVSTTNNFINFNSSDRIPKISMSKSIRLPDNSNDGIIISLMSEQARDLENPYFSLTETPIFPNRIVTAFINPFNYSRVGITHGLSLSTNRAARKQNIGFSLGGNVEIQDRTPFINNINRIRYFKSADLSFVKHPAVNITTGAIFKINEGINSISTRIIR